MNGNILTSLGSRTTLELVYFFVRWTLTEPLETRNGVYTLKEEDKYYNITRLNIRLLHSTLIPTSLITRLTECVISYQFPPHTFLENNTLFLLHVPDMYLLSSNHIFIFVEYLFSVT